MKICRFMGRLSVGLFFRIFAQINGELSRVVSPAGEVLLCPHKRTQKAAQKPRFLRTSFGADLIPAVLPIRRLWTTHPSPARCRTMEMIVSFCSRPTPPDPGCVRRPRRGLGPARRIPPHQSADRHQAPLSVGSLLPTEGSQGGSIGGHECVPTRRAGQV